MANIFGGGGNADAANRNPPEQQKKPTDQPSAQQADKEGAQNFATASGFNLPGLGVREPPAEEQSTQVNKGSMPGLFAGMGVAQPPP